MKLEANETHRQSGKSKIDRYKWVTKDQPGTFAWIKKTDLFVDRSYQREANHSKVLAIASAWSWISCGAISVAHRTHEGRYYVVEGQHRVMAALKRADVDVLPCMVFESEGQEHEAGGFYDANVNRRPVTTLERWNAQLVRKDETTVFVNNLILEAGRVPGKGSSPKEVRCLASLLRAATTNRSALLRLWPLLVTVCDGHAMHERVVDGLFYIEIRMRDGQSLTDKIWRDRVIRVGYEGLVSAAARASAFYSAGGAKVWATGMIEALNKGCRIHLQLKSEGQ